jgi:hypothetical protein
VEMRNEKKKKGRRKRGKVKSGEWGSYKNGEKYYKREEIYDYGGFLDFNFRHVLCVVCFLLSNSPGVSILYADVSEHSVP